jgi:hypothetical protein
MEIQDKIPKHVTYSKTSLGRLQLCLTRIVIGEEQVPQQGLKVPFRDGLLKHVAQDVYKLAKDGLLRRGYKEVGFLNVIEETVRTGMNHYFLPSFPCLVNCQQCLDLRL